MPLRAFTSESTQATWSPDGHLFLWRPSGPAAGPDKARLAVGPNRVRTVRGRRLSMAEALPALASFPAGADPTDSVRCWSLAAKLSLELAAMQRTIPTVTDGEAHWRALLTRTGDVARASAIAASLPPAGRAFPAAVRPVRLVPSAAVVRSFLDAAIDHLYRTGAWPGPSRGWPRALAEALRGDTADFALSDARWAGMPARIAEWAATAEDPGPRVGFHLALPDAEGRFPLRLRLHASSDPSETIPLVEGFGAGAAVRIGDRVHPRPAESSIRGLARAARIYPPLARALRGDRPTDVVLEPAEAWAFLETGRMALEDAGFPVDLPTAFRAAGQQRIRARLRIGLDEPSGAVRTTWEVTIGEHLLTGAAFRGLLALRQPIAKWRGSWVFLDPREIERLPEELNETGSLPLPAALRAALTGTHDDTPVVVDTSLTKLLAAVREPPALDPPDTLQATLRPYQLAGFRWLCTLGRLGLGALLADDMGLGKTVQVIAHLLTRTEAAARSLPHLVICPTSVLGNWERELNRFAPSLKVARWHGAERSASFGEVDVVLTTYGLLVRDDDVLAAHEWDVVALDEAQAIKNPDSLRARSARLLRARHVIAMTGTPIENRLEELWSLMQFLVPGLLGPRRTFLREVAVPVERFADEHAAHRLRLTVSPFLLRRCKSDPNILDDLPDKLERRVFCALTSEQRALYDAEVERAMEDIGASSDQKRRGRVLAMLTALKQICNHPAHFLGGEPGELPRRSGKLDRLAELVDAIVACGERAVVFTQYRQMGELLRRHLADQLGCTVPFLHGGTLVAARDRMVEAFQQDVRACPVLLVSLRAGGTGLNLTRATHVLHYDRWWNPAVEDQATDRAYRIGQHHNVQVHKLLCEDSLEERIDALLERKRELSRTVVGSGERFVTELDDDALRALVALPRTDA